ncbi:glycerate 2-kinase [Sulfolobus tengchongensis]|uniref:Glycerate 2-kinase n=1 Tax=Sulfolobus tengchongensis TaxID=207809 RepID=A0AAX4KZ16_9CREN
MKEIIKKILEFSDPYRALQEKVRINDNTISFNDERVYFKKPILIAVGKASIPMAEFFRQRISLKAEIVITPKGTSKGGDVIEAGHPLPDENSIKAGKKVLDLLLNEDYDLVIFAISGGASALLEYSDIPIEELKMINKLLVTSGIGIDKINIVRKHLSKIKGGKIIEYVKDRAPVISFIVSDVPGNDISSIGSGLTSIDKSTINDALMLLRKVGLENYAKYLTETPKSFSRTIINYLILDNMEVLKKLSNYLGNSLILTSEVRGEAKDVGVFMASIYNSSENYGIPLKRPYYLLLGGEPEVTIKGKTGKGGRNGEVCLSFLKYVKKSGKFELLSFATDGIDGNSDYAGCVISSNTNINEDEINDALETHNSYGLLERYESTIRTGYTYTNVNNIYVLNAP